MQEENLRYNILGEEHIKHLLIRKFDLLKLPVQILRKLSIYLLKQFIVQVEVDSYWYWALTHDVVKTHEGYMVFKDWPLLNSFNTLMATHFASTSSQGVDPALDRLNRAVSAILPEPVKDLVLNRDFILMYTCYPVLEGLVKFALSPLISPNGRPKTTFNLGKKIYTPKNQINSLATLLRILEEKASTHLSNPELGNSLKNFRIQLEILIPQKGRELNGWDTIYRRLRSPSLHGEIGMQLRSGLITNLICLIIWYLIDEQSLGKSLEDLLERPQTWRSPNQYYPPVF